MCLSVLLVFKEAVTVAVLYRRVAETVVRRDSGRRCGMSRRAKGYTIIPLNASG